MTEEARFDHVALIGVGLINGSIARDMRRLGLCDRFTGCARSRQSLERAHALGLIDQAANDPADAVAGADLVVLGVPVGAMGAVCHAMNTGLADHALVTDVGSTKASVVRDVGAALRDPARFVAGHPVAGTEHSGPDAAIEHLFEGRWTLLTPTKSTHERALARIEALWRALGARVRTMSPEHHDQVLGITSHLPHYLSFAIVNAVDDLADDLESEVLAYAAGGFTDFTRIASSDPDMWADIALANRAAVLEMIDRFSEELIALRREVRRGDRAALHSRITRARSIRQKVVEAGQAYDRLPVRQD
ncbi:MAG: prephenate dehydrogenase/arogenate dehydrogenase family protein [Geminicoccaceae bacterium]